MKIPTENCPHIVSETKGVEEGEELQQSRVVGLREPRLDGYCIV